jgi:cytidylate kinase
MIFFLFAAAKFFPNNSAVFRISGLGTNYAAGRFMSSQPDFAKCISFIASQFQAGNEPDPDSKLAITISRQSGSGGHAVAEKLVQYMAARAPKSALPWMVFDRNLVEQVLEDHHLPQHLVRLMPEDRVSDLTDMLHNVFGLHPPFYTLVHQTSETILRLASQGNVILIGRGANLVTGKLPHVVHVRLIGSLQKRVAHIQEIRSVDRKTALEIIQSEDRGRERYLKKYFNENVENPLLYDLVINTDLVTYEEAAHLIGDAASRRLEKLSPRREVEPARVSFSRALTEKM